MKKELLGCLLSASCTVNAGVMGPIATVSPSGFYAGLGAGYHSVKLDQTLNLLGLNSVYSGSTLVAVGEATGPTEPFHPIVMTFSPEAQAGYFRYFGESNHYWGVKFVYQYLAWSAATGPLIAFQAGQFVTTSSAPTDTTFTGHATIESVQPAVNHEMELFAVLGHSFGKFSFYLGGAPAVFQTSTHAYSVTGYADINGSHEDQTGNPVNLVSAKWMWGGAGQLGMTYAIDSTWFLDVNYTYAVTGMYHTHYVSPFTSFTQGYTNHGVMNGLLAQRVTSQGVVISVNKLFA